MKNSKGFSLVELVVAVAIMSVVGVAVIGFCMAGTNSYQKVGGDADLQYESQLLMNQLEDLLVDTNKGYGYDASAKTLSVYNESDAYKVIWNDTESRVYLEKYGRTANQLYLISTNLMAEYVTNFSVSIPSENESTKQVITIAASMEKGDNRFQATKSFTLRNELDEFNSMEEAYPDDDLVNWTITSVRILDNEDNPVSDMSNVGRNQQIQFKSIVNGTNFPADATEAAKLQDVEWSVVSTGNTRKSDDTTVVGGLLTIAEDEPASALILTATSVWNSNCSSSIIISLEEIVRTFDHVDVTHDGTEDKVVTGSTLQFYANVVGENLSTNQKKKVNWSVSAPAGETLSPQTQISADGVLTVATTETASKIIVTAVSYYNADCTGTSVVEVTVPPASVDSMVIRKTGTDIDISDALYLAKKGTVNLTAVIEGQNLVDLNEYIKKTVTWSVSSTLSGISYGAGDDSVNAVLTIGEHETATTLTVTATAAADPATPQKTATISVRVENISGVNVTGPGSAELGQNATFAAALTGGVLPEGVDNANFSWSVDSTNSTISDGVLTVGASETKEQLTVTASYTAADGTIYSGNATIDVVAYRSVSIFKEGDSTDYAGRTIPGEYDSTIPLQLSGMVNGSHIVDNTVRWTVSSESGSLDSGTSIDTNGRLVIGASESSEKLRVTATSNKVSTLSSVVYVTVKRPSPVIKIYYGGTDVTGKSVSVTKKRDDDKKVKFTATVSNASGATVSWKLSGNSHSKTKIDESSGKLKINESELGPLTVTAEITYNGRKYQASVTVNVLEAGVKIDSVGIALGLYYVYDYDIKPGETVDFWAYVDVESYDAKYQSVTWSIEGNHHADTTLVDGTLYVSPAETNSDFVIRATSTYDATKSGTTNIHVQFPKATEIVLKKGSENVTQKTLDVYQGETLTLTATVSGNHLVTDAQKSVTWACEGNNSVETSISNGVVTISENETAEQLTITATSFDGLVKEYVYLRILKPVVTGVVILQNNAVVSTTTPTVVYAGTETQVQYTARVDGNGLLDKHKKVSWSLLDPSDTKASISADGLLVIAADHPTGELQVCATSVFDTSKTCTITIRIDAVSFDKVTITFENDHRVVTSTDQIRAVQGAVLDFSAIADGSGLTEEQKKNITWSVSGSDIVSGAPATTIVNGKLSISPGEKENTILTVKAASEDAAVFDTVQVKVEKLTIRLYSNTTTPSKGSIGINIAKGSGTVNGYYHVCYDVSGSYASTCEFSYAMTGNGLSVSENGTIGTDKTVLQIVATKDAGTSGKVSIRVRDYEMASVNVTVQTSKIEEIDGRRYYIFNSAAWTEIQYDCMKSYYLHDRLILWDYYEVIDSPLFS